MPRQSPKHATVFLGGGRITGALIAGLRLAGYARPIVVYDRNAKKLRALKRDYRIEIARDLESAISRAEMLILAVRPASVSELLGEIGHCARIPAVLAVSLAAGIPLARLRARLGSPVRWARAMPSPVSRIRRGLTAVTFAPGVSEADRRQVRSFFEHVGTVLQIHERQFDAFTAIYSSSHGYHALAALATAAEHAGLDHKTALVAASHALANGILYWRDGRLDLVELLHEAATPGGIAATTMAAMDKAGYRKAISRGVLAGIRQAKKNARR